jgi:hypothetical protein
MVLGDLIPSGAKSGANPLARQYAVIRSITQAGANPPSLGRASI